MTKTAVKDEALHAARAQAVEPQPPAMRPLGGAPGGPGSMQQTPMLPEDCPVVPLGKKGKEYFFLSADQTLYSILASKFTQNEMISLYGGSLWYLEATWPRVGEKNKITGVSTLECYAAHMASCNAKGVWDPSSKLREGGGWREADGTLVLHCGNILFTKQLNGVETQHRPGFLGYHVYSRCPSQPQPWPDRVTGKALEQLLAGFSTFAWGRGELDGYLLLGWCVAAQMGGAIKWRPGMWIIGAKGSGKSTLQEMLENLFGGALVHASDASAAGIYQALKLSSRPVTLDEMEAQEDNRRAQAIVQLVRQASSGGLVLRGGQDHTGVEFNLRSSFLATSINHPPLGSQDLSRLTILELGKWQGQPHGLSPDKLHELGRKILRRIVDGWPKWEERLAMWRAGIMRLGHSDRFADQFGTLLAAADLALHDRVPHPDSVDTELERLKVHELTDRAEERSDARDMLDYLLTTPLDLRPGARTSVAKMLEEFLGRTADISEAARGRADYDLQSIGLKPFFYEKHWWLAIASYHQGLARVFDGSHWRGKSGAAGVWVQAARRVSGAVVHPSPLRFNGVQFKVTLMPMDVVMPPEAAPLIENQGGTQ